MRGFKKFLCLMLSGALFNSSAFAKSPISSMDKIRLEIIQSLDNTVVQYSHFQTASDWLVSYEKSGHLTKDDAEFFHNEFVTENSKLPPLKRAGTDLKIGGQNYQTVIKFEHVNEKAIEINNHTISFEGLTARQFYGKVKEALPKNNALNQFSFFPEANAIGPVVAAFLVALAALAGVSAYSDYRMTKGTDACEKALNDPLFRRPPQNDKDREDLAKMMDAVNSFKTWGMDNGMTWNDDTVKKFKDCLDRISARYDQQVPVQTSKSHGTAN